MSEADPVGARPARRPDVGSVGATLTAAFRDDPVWRWLVPDVRRWRRGVPHVFRVTALDHLATTWVASAVTSAAVWAPPGHRVDRWRQAMHGPGQLAVFRSHSLVGLRLQEELHRAHPQEPHWYLHLLGTDPVHQGRGHGSAVLQPVLDRCDHDALPAYLESSKETNIPFYRSHGFEVRSEFRPVDGCPPMWPMWRQPR
jgi:ribosomal protein S18 acetylase RimI-like enzyme